MRSPPQKKTPKTRPSGKKRVGGERKEKSLRSRPVHGGKWHKAGKGAAIKLEVVPKTVKGRGQPKRPKGGVPPEKKVNKREDCFSPPTATIKGERTVENRGKAQFLSLIILEGFLGFKKGNREARQVAVVEERGCEPVLTVGKGKFIMQKKKGSRLGQLHQSFGGGGWVGLGWGKGPGKRGDNIKTRRKKSRAQSGEEVAQKKKNSG